MTSSRQIGPVIAVACALSVSLSGCALVDGAGKVWGILESEAAQHRALNLAGAELERIEGVQSVSSRFTQTPRRVMLPSSTLLSLPIYPTSRRS